MADQEKIYIGTGKRKEFASGGSIIRFSLTEKDLDTLHSHLDNGWVSINISERKKPSERGATHYATVDTWKPTRTDPAAAQPSEQHPEDKPGDDLPF